MRRFLLQLFLVLAPLSAGAQAIDTLDTADSNVRIVLYADHSWRYVSDPSVHASDDLFTEYWDTVAVHSYRSAPDSTLKLPVTLALVDSVSAFVMPCDSWVISGYGPRRRRFHSGVDLPFPTGTPVLAAFDGQVRFASYNSGGYGFLVVVRHINGLETFYGHLSRFNCKVGDWVREGDLIAFGGSTGRSTGPHLHFETRYMGHPFDPMWIIDFDKKQLRSEQFCLKKEYLDRGASFRNYVRTGNPQAPEMTLSYHIVRKGDTLSRIATKYHTSVRALCRLNGISENTVLQLGKKLKVR